jgi:hypothetical protein
VVAVVARSVDEAVVGSGKVCVGNLESDCQLCVGAFGTNMASANRKIFGI